MASKYKRILIVGSSGSGKSTLAQELGKVSALPVFHLDMYYWLPDWVETDAVLFDKEVQNICARASWIIEGAYDFTFEKLFNRSDLIVFLNIPIEVCIENVSRRCSEGKALGLRECLKESIFEEKIQSMKQRSIGIINEIYRLKPKYLTKFIQIDSMNEIEAFIKSVK